MTMPTKIEDIRWGSYNTFEGPWYPGVLKYELPKNPTLEHQVISVITATEGGALDAINRYDSCIDTQGVIQWCNRSPLYFVDQMYTLLDDAALAHVQSVAATREYRFDKASGHFQGRHGVPVSTVDQQASMYFAGASGSKGGWSDEQKYAAKLWVAAAADVWQSPAAREAQIQFTAKRVAMFFLVGALSKDLTREAREVSSPESLAFYAAYLSFAANNPRKASEALQAAVNEMGDKVERFTFPWLLSVLKHLVFDPGISIYPGRYNKIRPVIERLFGVDLPDMAEDIAKFNRTFPDQFLDIGDVQRALIRLGYDLGPKGADGVFGKKSTWALREFELSSGAAQSEADGILDWKTLSLLEQAMKKLGVDGVINA